MFIIPCNIWEIIYTSIVYNKTLFNDIVIYIEVVLLLTDENIAFYLRGLIYVIADVAIDIIMTPHYDFYV